MKISDLLTGVENKLYKSEQHENLHGGEGNVTLIIPADSDSDSTLEGFILLECDGNVSPSIGEHGHSEDTAEKYTVLLGSVKVNNRVLFEGENIICHAGKQHSIQLLDKFALVEFTKYHE